MTERDVTFASMERAEGERFVPLRRRLGVSSFGMNLVILTPGQRGRIHAHAHQEEVYLVLEGELTLALGPGEQEVLPSGRIVRVGPHVRRQLINSGAETLVLLALGAAGEHAGRDGAAWTSWDEPGPGRSPQEVPLPEDLAEDPRHVS